MDFIFVLVLGALWGSFANVCIHRLPIEKGVVSGRSFCPKCNKVITWKDNIPIISFLFLRGRCRNCNKRISSQYLLVEAMSVLLFLIIYIIYGLSITTLLLLILSLSFLIIFFIDFKHYIIPNVLSSVIVYSTLLIPQFMLLEAFLSFLGLGVQPPESSWGILIREGAITMEEYWWLLIFPSIVFSLTLFALNFLGDGLRDYLDPRKTQQLS